MEKQDFLNYISFLLEKKDSVYFSKNDNYFYFYHKNFAFYLKSTASSAALEVNEEKNRKEYSESIDLTPEEAKILLLKCMALVDNSSFHSEKNIKNYGEDLLQENLKELKTLLACEKLEEKVRKTRSHKEIFVINSLDFVVNFGEIIKDEYEKRPTMFLTSMVKLPIYIAKPEDKTNMIVYDLIIPSWEIKNYPILKNNIDLKIFGTDFSDKINNIVNTFPSGELFLKENIDFLLKRSDKKVLVNKI